MNKPVNLSYKAVQIIALAIMAMLFFSCLSFDAGDFPSRYVWPNNHPAANWCGSVGAFFAYYLMYYAGAGVFVVLAASITAIVIKFANKEIGQPIIRSIGMVLVAAAVSAIFYIFRPHSPSGLPVGAGGVLGASTVLFLKNNFSMLGTVIIILSSFIVGAILLADALVMAVLHLIGAAFAKISGVFAPAWSAARDNSKRLSEIWKKLSVKKAQPSVAQLLAEEAQHIANQAPHQIVQADEVIEVHLEKKLSLSKSEGRGAKTSDEPAYESESYENFTLPPLDMLMEPEYSFGSVQEKIIRAKSTALEQVLNEFGIEARVADSDPGPTITMFELALAPGVKVSQISNLSNDIARALGAPAVRVVAPLPGKHTIGIEVPNSQKETVRLKDLVVRAGDNYKQMELPLFLGKDSSGQAIVSDLTTMPHLLIAGTTGSGKSVCINSIIMSIMLTKRPDEVKLVLVDPKMVEMTAFSKIPHLMAPIVTEISKAEQIFEWATMKMDERYALFAEAGVKNIAGYNSLGSEEIIRRFDPQSPEEEAKIPKRLPYYMIIVDELADLMMTSSKEIENYIVRIAQKSRAVGIHIVLATQRPQATVVTGLIKANLPSRISFRVATRLDSRIVLDQNGAETLLGQGDMLFLKPGTSDLIRAQGAFVDETEVRKVVQHLTEQAEPQFHPELMQLNRIDAGEACKDEMFDDAVRLILESQRGSVSLLQRKLSIGYARASRIIEAMAASGILGEYKGSQAREVLITIQEYERLKQQMDADKRAGFTDMQNESPDDDEDLTPEKTSHSVKEVDYDYTPAQQEQKEILNS
ncbi:MAG: DNA translocase FtsK [Planctomycetes bacterium]|nr:DNA translocase FtsK [Planctomycetota bacterium]MBU2457921.1 DNA translocase FtsK [Planctomycetota bacterium]MBU2596651.1 DNA translocase FtsK [Planctomycetota bacterium]